MEAALVTQLNIIRLFEMKPNFSELARSYGVDRRTVKKYYNGYEGKPKTRNKTSMLDQHYDTIRTKLQIIGTTVRAVYEYFIDQGIDVGGYSNFNKYIKSKGLKPKKTPKGHPRFETLPGVQGQADWKEDITMTSRNGVAYTFNVFNYKLGNSRYCHFTYKTNRTRQDVFDCLIAAFKSAGGVPKEILFDNMTSVVDLNGNHRSVNPKMKAFADDFGFKIRLCKPRHSFTKGKVEASNKFMDWLLPYEGEFDTEDDLIKIIEKVNLKVNMYVNQATNVPPVLLFQKEKEYLQPLPRIGIVESYMSTDRQAKVHKDSLFAYQGCRYSVPPKYIDQYVFVKQLENVLQVYYNTELITVHTISDKKINYHSEHYKQLLAISFKDKEDIDSVAAANLSHMDRFLK
jgi:transposase